MISGRGSMNEPCWILFGIVLGVLGFELVKVFKN